MGAVSGAMLKRIKPTAEAAVAQAPQENYPLRKSAHRRELWPPQRSAKAAAGVERQTSQAR